VFEDGVTVRPGPRRELHRLDELVVGQPQLGRGGGETVPVQAAGELPEPLRVAAEEGAEERTEPDLLAVRAGAREETVDRVRDLVAPPLPGG
jgi:hypothetical protein